MRVDQAAEVSSYFSYSYSTSPSPQAGDVSRFTQTNMDSDLPPVPTIIEEVLDEEYEEQKLDVVEDLTDDELDKISCYIVQESLDAAASNTDMEVKTEFLIHLYFHILIVFCYF